MIEVRQLCKSFGSNQILDNVSFQIEKGESVVILGRSGGGKSVLLKMLIGLEDAHVFYVSTFGKVEHLL